MLKRKRDIAAIVAGQLMSDSDLENKNIASPPCVLERQAATFLMPGADLILHRPFTPGTEFMRRLHLIFRIDLLMGLNGIFLLLILMKFISAI
ncbi:hypothetical protein [Phyllobacterium phragmitis]|uniref:hypothetical protein n=1 Tax=Phyllobacterium phragmitis TaxID=2670329 RepID=UPI003CCA37A6